VTAESAALMERERRIGDIVLSRSCHRRWRWQVEPRRRELADERAHALGDRRRADSDTLPSAGSRSRIEGGNRTGRRSETAPTRVGYDAISPRPNETKVLAAILICSNVELQE
jgi:hypothetical protein